LLLLSRKFFFRTQQRRPWRLCSFPPPVSSRICNVLYLRTWWNKDAFSSDGEYYSLISVYSIVVCQLWICNILALQYFLFMKFLLSYILLPVLNHTYAHSKRFLLHYYISFCYVVPLYVYIAAHCLMTSPLSFAALCRWFYSVRNIPLIPSP
jgi:hypothetical protein